MSGSDVINKILGNGKFIASAHHPSKPNKIDDETWWVPNKSGYINKGYFETYYYDKSKNLVKDKSGRIIQKL